MALSNFNLPIGVSERNNFDLSTQTLTTTDFFTPKLVYSHEVCPGESWKCQVSAMTRTIPLYKPIYSDLSNNIRFFFVPFRTVMYDFNDFINNVSPHADAFDKVYYSRTSAFVLAFLDNNIVSGDDERTYRSYKYVDMVSGTDYDFQVFVSSDSVDSPSTGKYKFNKRGRFLYDVLLGLGYQLQFGNVSVNLDTPSSSYRAGMSLDDFSVMPLLCYLKVYFDYYCNPLYTHYRECQHLLDTIFRSNTTSHSLGSSYIKQIFSLIEPVSYDNDYFTSSWESPFGPQVGSTGTNPSQVVSGIQLNDPANPDAYVAYDNSLNEATVENGNVGTDSITLSQYLDTALHKISNLFHKYNMVGVRSIDRYMSERGIKLDSAFSNRCIYIGHRNSPFTVSDVTSTGDYDSLADYKGKALSYNLDGNFEFTSSEFGMIIAISTVIPRVQYCQGMPRHLHHLSIYDFFTPSLDKLGVQPIRCDELWSRNLDSSKTLPSQGLGISDSSVLGYTSMYGEYKCNPHCVRSGIFSLPSQNGIALSDINYSESKGLTQTWHLWRLFDDYERQGNYLRDTEDREQYDRIFDMVDGTVDGFIQIFNFKVKCSLPMSKMFESYDFGEDEANRKVNVRRGGTFVD